VAARHKLPAVFPSRPYVSGGGLISYAGIAHVDRGQLHAQCRGHNLHRAELSDPGGDGGIAKHRCPRHAGRDLLEQLQPFPAYAVFVNGEPGRVAARLCHACDETRTDRIDDDREHDRNGSRGLQQRCHDCGAGRSHEDVGRNCDQFGRVPLDVAGIGPAGIDPQIATLAPSQLAERACVNAACRACPSASFAARYVSTPMRRTRSSCCARATSGHDTAAPPSSVVNSRRLMLIPAG
jgi:hypothetical protein